MDPIDKWADRVYGETDFGRSIATTVAGIVGLCSYLYFQDWVISAFSAIIAFPVTRLISTGLHEKVNRKAKRIELQEEAEYIYGNLSDQEKGVIKVFVDAGGSVLTWGQVNRIGVNGPAIESLIQREIIWTSVTADGMTETFALNSEVFDAAQKGSNA